MTIGPSELQAQVTAAAERLAVPGVAVGIWNAGEEQYAFWGVTSVENPLPIDENTLFQFGSTGKTFTATAVMRLVERGLLVLDDPVRTHVPELRLKDEDTARTVTLLHLLNHTAGWSGDLMTNTGDGDDALARYVELMGDLDQVTPLGSTVSYNNASLSLAGRVIENVTGMTFEQAIRDLILDPLGLRNSFFFTNEIMTRRFAAGHVQKPDGTIAVTRPWAMSRAGSPAGGISSNAADLIAWARFHLGDGRGHDGTQLLSRELLDAMKRPTVAMPGSALGDFVGIAWLLRDVDGVRLVGHGGDTIGHHSDFVMVPERDFAITTLTNCGPNGPQFNHEIVRWALEAYLGVVDRDPEALVLADEALDEYAGTYETIAAVCDLVVADGGLVVKITIRPEVLAQLREAGEDEPEQPPIPIRLLPGEGDRYIVSDGPAKGMKGYFARDASGMIAGVHIGGRMAMRTAPVAVTAG